MERQIKAFYPSGTEKLIHRGKDGNVYKLDAIDQPVRIKEKLENDSRFTVVEVKGMEGAVLLYAHAPDLIQSYRSGKPVELAQSSGLLWQPDFYPWVLNKAWATIEAVDEALINGKSLAITSGGHHSEFEKGLGFGPINNMIIATKDLLIREPERKIAILDLDVHYANGTHSQVVNEKRILSCDIWRYKLPYWKYTENSENIFHKKVDNAKDYFEALDLMYERIESFKPDILFLYNGLDPLSNDRMGGVEDFNEEALLKRNKSVAKFVRKNKLPVCVFVGGGYIDYSKSPNEIEEHKNHLTELFVNSTAAIFGLV